MLNLAAENDTLKIQEVDFTSLKKISQLSCYSKQKKSLNSAYLNQNNRADGRPKKDPGAADADTASKSPLTPRKSTQRRASISARSPEHSPARCHGTCAAFLGCADQRCYPSMPTRIPHTHPISLSSTAPATLHPEPRGPDRPPAPPIGRAAPHP